MNRIFGRVWSEALQAWVVTSELASSQGRKAGRSRLRDATLGVAVLSSALALVPQQVLAQQITIERTGNVCSVLDANGAVTGQVDCAVFEQANAGINTVTGSGYFLADGAADGSDDPVVGGEHAVAAGANSVANGSESSAYGFQSDAEGNYATAMGSNSLA